MDEWPVGLPLYARRALRALLARLAPFSRITPTRATTAHSPPPPSLSEHPVTLHRTLTPYCPACNECARTTPDSAPFQLDTIATLRASSGFALLALDRLNSRGSLRSSAIPAEWLDVRRVSRSSSPFKGCDSIESEPFGASSWESFVLAPCRSSPPPDSRSLTLTSSCALPVAPHRSSTQPRRRRTGACVNMPRARTHFATT